MKYAVSFVMEIISVSCEDFVFKSLMRSMIELEIKNPLVDIHGPEENIYGSLGVLGSRADETFLGLK